MAVEFFVSRGQLIVNEMAPRPHNSGHYTIDACVTNQFEQQVRALCGLPLGEPRAHSASVMVNLLGDLWYDGDTYREPDWAKLYAIPKQFLESMPMRRKTASLSWRGTFFSQTTKPPGFSRSWISPLG
jgi:phosphoribosylaminoimidazole carboxylase (NCAIR synthetase)